MDFFTAIEVSGSGLAAQRVRMNVASSNLANVSTTQTPEGGPYKRRDVSVASDVVNDQIVGHRAGGDYGDYVRAVKVDGIIEDATDPKIEYDPGHPDADEEGYVRYPNINMIEEMVDMITASRAYEAGVTVLSGAVRMAERAIGIGR